MNRLNNSLSSDAEQVEHLLNRYSGLVDRADALAFPSLRKGVLAPIETTHWSVPRRIMFRLVSPFSFLWSPPSGHNPFSVVIMAWIFGIWMVTFALWGVTLMAAIEVLRDVIANTAIPPSSSALPAALGYALFLYLMLAGFLMYWRWLEFWRDRRFFWYWRGMLTIVFIVGFVSTVPHTRFPQQNGCRARPRFAWTPEVAGSFRPPRHLFRSADGNIPVFSLFWKRFSVLLGCSEPCCPLSYRCIKPIHCL